MKANAAQAKAQVWIHFVLWGLVFLWVTFVGVASWQKVRLAQQPPVWDVQSYFSKAQGFWTQVGSRVLPNPFNVEPTIRPPGTILMSYPFGFSQDFHGFYFRSFFWGVLGVIVA